MKKLMAVATVVAGVALGLTGCADAEAKRDGAALGSGSTKVTCDGNGSFIGSGEPDWRQDSVHAGPLGFGGSGRDINPIHGSRGDDGLLHVKMPALLEGHRPAEVRVPPSERDRVSIEVVVARKDYPGHPYNRVTLVPCDDKPRTIWPAGLVFRERSPGTVSLRVRVGEWSGTLRIGRASG